jgi:integration host factor subunit beta
MIRSELIKDVCGNLEISRKQATVLVDTIFDSIMEALTKGDKVEIRNFGSFKVRVRGARKGRNPRTGESVQVQDKNIPFFKPGKELKNLIEK